MHKILYNTPPRDKWIEKPKDKTIVYLDANYNVPGIGLVLSGIIKGSSIKVKDKLYIGPSNGKFYQVTIRSIHNSIREDVNELEPNVHGCFAVKFTNSKETLTRAQLKKGMVMIDNIENWKENIVDSFKAKIKVLHHSSTIRDGYTPVIHCGPIRQPAVIKLNTEEYLKSQDNAIVEFKFLKNKEFVEKNMVFFFRDGSTKGVGEII
jgi:elongation factor 1-alpha